MINGIGYILEKLIGTTKEIFLKACAYAVLEKKDNMLKMLNFRIKSDYNNLIKAKYNPDFEGYREDKDFKTAIEKLEQKRKENAGVARINE